MKKSLLLFAMTLMGLTLTAKPVDPDRAVQVARNFVAQYVKGAENFAATVVYTHPMPESKQPAMYVVNVGGSFVIVSADDIAHPVLGYSLSRPWPTNERRNEKGEMRNGNTVLPPQVSGYLDDLANQIESAVGQQSVPDRETTTEWHQLTTEHLTLNTNLPDSVGPLLTTTWDQGQYYNALCPADVNGPDGHVPTGCVATAMAQIINYWGYPVHGRGIHSYNSNYGTLSVNYDSANYDYTNMPNVLTASSTPAQVNAVAMLMRDCGVAANMSYGSTESSSYDVDARVGLINFFRISPDASYAEKCLFSNVLWDSIIRADIATHRPVMYSGRGNLGGHAFVLDGYKQDGYFHFNFGWSGYADGWYLVDAITIGGYSFNNGQSALFGIFPDSTGNIILPGLSGISLYELNEPLFFLDFLGNNKYIGQDYTPTSVRPNSISQFYLNNEYDSIVVDILNYEGQSVLFHDGISNEQLNLFSIWSDSTLDDTLRFIYGGYTVNNTRPVVSTTNAISLSYYGYWSYDGFKMRVSKAGPCRIPSELQCMFENGNMNVSWQENGSSTMWQIEYGLTGYQDGEGIIITCDSLGTTIQGLEDMHIYDFRVRAICSETEYSEWSEIVTARVGTYWDDIVTEEPAGFSINNQGEILVSSPEALAWICKLKHMGYYSYATVKQTADIDLGGHWWRPISYFGVYDGQNHSINNLTVYEPQKQTGFGSGLFGNITDGMVINLTLESPVVLGCQVGGIAGYAVRSSIVNCAIINGNVKGTITGSIIGWLDDAFITNCYTSGLVAHRLELRRSGTIGGFCGNTASYNITNCYSSCDVEGHATLDEKGSFSGFVGGANTISYCYYYPVDNLAAVNGVNDSYFQNVSAIGMQLSLASNCVVNSVEYTDLLSALNAWVDANDTAGIYRHWAADSANVNGGFPVFAAIPCTTVTNSDSIVVCDSYTWHGTTYTTSTELIDTLSTLMGCDSIVTHHLIVNHSNTNNETVTACEDYFFGGQWIYSSGQYTDTLTTTAGCDSIITLNLTINNPVHVAVTEVACDSYTWQGATLTTSGTYTYPHNDANGCTQIDTLHLTINHSNTGIETVTACDSYTWHGTAYSASTNTATFTETNAAGCDSIVTLNLTVNYSNTGVETVTACDIYTWHGTAYTASNNTATFTETNANGCDSVVTLNLTVNYSNTGVETVTACDSYTWHGTNYTTTTNTPTFTETNAIGCDSVVTLNLTVKYSNTGIETVTACDSYTWHGAAYTASNYTATFTETNAIGCDSVVTLNLTVNYSNTGVETVTTCDSYTWHGTNYTANNNTATFTETNANGCDSVVTLNLTVNYSNSGVETVTACDTYTWHGTAYTANNNTATFTETNAAGCDSVVTLNLTINYSNTGVETVTACDSYTWHGTAYTASTNTPTFTETNAAGCDSVVTLNLTINYSDAVNETDTACEDYFFGGQWIYASGQYTDSLTNIAGCDSVVTLNLTINNPIHEAVTEVACDSYTWQGATLTVSGDYTFPHNDANGCTQVDTLHLTVNYSVETTVTDTAEDSYSWQGTTYTESGTYQWQGTTVDGCDSTVTLNLTITTSQEGIDEPITAIVRITVVDGRIVIDDIGAGANLPVQVYDVMGRQYPAFISRVSPFTLPNGVYLVKVGDLPARRVVVIR